MAIVENRSTEEGDIILIKAEVPIIGLIGLTDFIDTTLRETNREFYKKEFRYSNDGINFTNWIELTQTNLQNVQIDSRDNFLIEYRYTHVIDESVSISQSVSSLAFEDVELQGEFVEPPNTPIYDKSVFAQFFNMNDTEVLAWCINVTEKLYQEGIVPNYIERGEGFDISADRDYIDFWRTVACFFSYCVILARNIGRYQDNDELLEEFLQQRGLFFCNDTSFDELRYLMQNFNREIYKRGTWDIIREKDDNKPVNGELLRLICFFSGDEFIFNYIDNSKVNWNIGLASPLYKGNGNQDNCIKGYEQSKDFTDLTNYPLINKQYQRIVADGDKQVLEIDSTLEQSESVSGSLTVEDISESVYFKNLFTSVQNLNLDDDIGIGLDTFDKLIAVDPNINYEITFAIKQEQIEDSINFGCYSYDLNNNRIDTISISGQGSNNFFFKQKSLNKSDKFYYIRGIIYAYNSNALTQDQARLNIGYGQQLRFKNKNVAKIQPILTQDVSRSGTLKVWDFKIRPVSTPFGRGFVQTANFIDAWMRNRNGTYSNNRATEIIRKYLLPYNVQFKPIWLLDGELEAGDFNPNDFNNDFG